MLASNEEHNNTIAFLNNEVGQSNAEMDANNIVTKSPLFDKENLIERDDVRVPES